MSRPESPPCRLGMFVLISDFRDVELAPASLRGVSGAARYGARIAGRNARPGFNLGTTMGVACGA